MTFRERINEGSGSDGLLYRVAMDGSDGEKKFTLAELCDAGLARRKNVVSTMLMCFGTIGIVGVLWIVAGWSFAYGGDGSLSFFGGFDRVYDCAGGGRANTLCCRLLRPRGTYMKVGHHMAAVTYDESPVWWQELKIIGVDAHGMEEWQGRRLYTFDLVQEWMRDGIYQTEGFITHRFPLARYKDAFAVALKNPPELIKIVLDCSKA